ncbi:MAG: ABC transporter permease [Candidatus Heimdallarchaeota archaeon]|nr:ABC transporter permease [Candidatus Heimdallarchaeota archaeon]
MAGFLEKIRFYNHMVFMNRKATIVMFLGLGISLAIISESLMFMYSFQYGAFEGFYQGAPPRQFTVSVSSYDIREYPEASIPVLFNATTRSIENADMTDRVKRVDWFLTRGFFLVVKNLNSGMNTILPEFNMYAIPSDYFSALSNLLYNGTLPQSIDDAIIVAKESTLTKTNLSNIGRFPAYTPIFGYGYEEVVDLGIPLGGRYFNASGSITYETFSSVTGLLKDDFNAMTDYFSEQFIITSYTNFANIVSKLNYYPGYALATGRIAFNLELIDSFNIGKEIIELQRFSQEISREFTIDEFQIVIYSTLITLLRDFNKEFIIFQLFGLLFITPIVGMSLSLTSYSANLMKRRQKRQVSSMLQRGSSQKEVLYVLLFQVIELSITAILISAIIGYGFNWLINKSIGFLNFTGASIYPTINMSIFYFIIAFGFVLSLIVNAKSIWDMSQISTFEAYTEHQVKKPFWERLYLDLVLIFIGIVLWVIVKIQLKGTSAYAFAYGIGTTAPVLLILGSIMLATRIFPKIVNFISNKSWKSKKLGILALATRRSTRRRSDATRSLVLITLTFTLIFSSIITIQSYQNHDIETANYKIGADILLRNVDVSSNQTKIAVLGMEGVESATYLKMTSQLITYGRLTYSYIILGIDPEEFIRTAYFERQYLQGLSPENFFNRIKDNNDVVMQKDQLDIIDTYTGDQLSIRYEKYSLGITNRTLDVVGNYKYFPRFFVEFPDIEKSTIFRFTIVGNYDNVEAFAYSDFSIGGDLIVKVKDGFSIEGIATKIETELGRSVDSIADLMTTKEGSLRNTMLYGSLNASFLTSLIITISAVVLMILIQVFENEREVVTLKVLGMTPKQLFNLFLTEAMTIVLFGSILGIGIGIFAASMFIDILTFETIIPPTEMLFPPVQLSLASVILVIVSILSAAITAYLVFRRDTIKAIKQI